MKPTTLPPQMYAFEILLSHSKLQLHVHLCLFICSRVTPRLISQVLPTSSSSQMVTFTFSNGGVATMRTSGTEPKIKYYTELCAAPGNR